MEIINWQDTGDQPFVSPRKGYVDRVSPTQISGWVYDENQADQPLYVDVAVNDERVARLKACLYRDDLVKLGYGDGRKGFAFTPLGYLRGGENHIRVSFAGTEDVVDNGDHVILNVTGFDEIQKETETGLLELS